MLKLLFATVVAWMSLGATEGKPMDYTVEKQEKRFVIGISVKTSNENFHREGAPLWEKFYRENIAEKIPNRINQNNVGVYTDYEGDYTKPYTYIVGCEVSSLDSIPEGMKGVEMSASPYAIYTAQGEFPQSMLQTWQAIWKSPMKRAYATDIEIYPADFNPQTKPEIKIYIGIDE